MIYIKIKVIDICASICISTFLVGCAGAEDYSIKLPNKYDIVRSSTENIFIAKETGSDSWGETIIPPKIIQIAYDKKFIIGKSVGLKSSKTNLSEVPDYSNLYYWILDMEIEKKYGPFNEKDFISKKEELKISEKVVLKNLDSYKQNK